MELILGLLGLALLVIVYLRKWLLRREIPQQQAMDFNGEHFAVGSATLSRSGPQQARQSVVVVHGFVENFLYFTEYYADPALELTLLTSADYHVPANRARVQQADWASPPTERPGTIAYDAQVLIQAMCHLVTGTDVRVHGHSRGGAVVIEAARRRPDLFERAEIILEAPVLPQGKPYAELSASVRWFLPFVLPFWQQQPISPRNKGLWGPLDNPRKRELIMGLPFNARHCSTLMTNIRDIASWMASTTTEAYQPLKRGAILVPENDKVLAPASMLASASQAENLQVISIAGGSHFVIPDNPQSIPPLST